MSPHPAVEAMNNEVEAKVLKDANAHPDGAFKRELLLSLIRPGDRVTILVPAGIGRNGREWKEATGRAVMSGPAGWVLNLGGRHGTPGIASDENLVKVERRRG